VGLRAGVDPLEKRKILNSAGNQTLPSLYLLSYPGSERNIILLAVVMMLHVQLFPHITSGRNSGNDIYAWPYALSEYFVGGAKPLPQYSHKESYVARRIQIIPI
jgi:hypothetical protein